MTRIIDGKSIAEDIYKELKEEVDRLSDKPGLAVVLVGDDPASLVYVRNKERACKRLNLNYRLAKFPPSISREELKSSIEKLNADKSINGIIVQLPVPEHLDSFGIISSVDPLKDVDGLHPDNMGRLVSGRPRLIPCTPLGIVELIKREGIDVRGKRAVIVGRSNLVGKPLIHLLLSLDATVTVCHSKTADLKRETSEGDILVVAVGKPRFITKDMVKEGAVVIDVGINRVENKLVGDVDFEEVASITSLITPVPGGVGPMTVAMLMKNLITAYNIQSNKQ
ncbi:MAG TPA: bifunctional methylenetetrahydrofolate dehydrogenase/methenyltetrahydrofolate cyclohydrolase FolD [bacterium]|nr:bifunctional methylenetetrahydrofolate dehydrogenase/methenyltetrahydrofolate cyclohydrolase FolD [bacterium]